jgi:5-hydroxyisourate hydrolase
MDTTPTIGDYRLTFEIVAYFAAQKKSGFYPFVQITFSVRNSRHHHVPLLLNAFGYSTHRGR